MSAPTTKRLLSGRRPTGPIHLGHVLGAIDSWVGLQDDYDCFFFSADWHALTTGHQDRLEIERLTLENWADILACGVDPERSVCFVQSQVKAHAELWLLSDSPESLRGCEVAAALRTANAGIPLCQWTVPPVPADTNCRGPRLRCRLPAEGAGTFELVLTVQDHPEWNSVYRLLFTQPHGEQSKTEKAGRTDCD